MYSGITKIYYRKTVRHVFTKPVQIEGTTQIPPHPVTFFHRSSHFCRQAMRVCVVRKWPLGGRSFVCWNITHPPADKTIRAWYKQFTETGCLCKQKSSGRPLTAEDDV
jgi:hypothetical protein